MPGSLSNAASVARFADSKKLVAPTDAARRKRWNPQHRLSACCPNSAPVHAFAHEAAPAFADPESLTALARLYVQARSAATQRAIAGILLRADYPGPARAELARSPREHRLKSSDSGDVIDALIRRLQISQAF